jgi:hypothetical protein
VDGSLFEDLGEDSSVIGFAGPCAIDANGHYFAGRAVMNGRFQDGIDTAANLELTTAEFNAAFIHEFGHFSGLDHSQINVECASNACGADNLAGLPTMFPFPCQRSASHFVHRRRRLDIKALPGGRRRRVQCNAWHDPRHGLFLRRRIAGAVRKCRRPPRRHRR